jgi:hypothetical protein
VIIQLFENYSVLLAVAFPEGSKVKEAELMQ